LCPRNDNLKPRSRERPSNRISDIKEGVHEKGKNLNLLYGCGHFVVIGRLGGRRVGRDHNRGYAADIRQGPDQIRSRYVLEASSQTRCRRRDEAGVEGSESADKGPEGQESGLLDLPRFFVRSCASDDLSMQCKFMGTFYASSGWLPDKLGPLAEDYLAVSPWDWWRNGDMLMIREMKDYAAKGYPDVKPRDISYMRGFCPY
jgi:hypothetical protein